MESDPFYIPIGPPLFIVLVFAIVFTLEGLWFKYIDILRAGKYEKRLKYIKEFRLRSQSVFVASIILIIIAGGGISVIIGAILVLTHLHKIGRLLITLGSGMGLIGSIVFIMWNVTFAPSVGLFFLGLLLDFYFIGVILTIIGRKKMKVKEEEEFEEDDFEPLLTPKESELTVPSDTLPCPVCDTRNPKTATYCRHCGTSLNYDLESYL